MYRILFVAYILAAVTDPPAERGDFPWGGVLT